MIRIALFLTTNLAAMMDSNIVLSLTGIQSSTIQNLMIMSLLFGFGGSLVSLLISKWIALKSVRGEVLRTPRNDMNQWLIETVAYLSRQASIFMPEIEIYHAQDLNAFSTGKNRNASLLALSTGLLKNICRDEIEAVITHEISHISNGDMVTMTIIQGVASTCMIFISGVLAKIFSVLIEENQDENKKSNSNSTAYFLIKTVLELLFGMLVNIITM